MSKEDILRDGKGVIWACGDQDYDVNGNPSIFYAMPSLPVVERSMCKITVIPAFAEKDVSYGEGSDGGLSCIIPKIATPDSSGPWIRMMYACMINPILTQAGRDSEGRTFDAQLLGKYMKNRDGDMRVCLFVCLFVCLLRFPFLRACQ